jgi:hypothetical protein
LDSGKRRTQSCSLHLLAAGEDTYWIRGGASLAIAMAVVPADPARYSTRSYWPSTLLPWRLEQHETRAKHLPTRREGPNLHSSPLLSWILSPPPPQPISSSKHCTRAHTDASTNRHLTSIRKMISFFQVLSPVCVQSTKLSQYIISFKEMRVLITISIKLVAPRDFVRKIDLK